MPEYETIPLDTFLKNVRSLRIPVEYIRDEDGSWSCWTEFDTDGYINTYGVGATLDEAIDDYVDALKEIAECIYEDNLPEDNMSVEYFAKIFMSPKEILKQCLDGKISEDS